MKMKWSMRKEYHRSNFHSGYRCWKIISQLKSILSNYCQLNDFVKWAENFSSPSSSFHLAIVKATQRNELRRFFEVLRGRQWIRNELRFLLGGNGTCVRLNDATWERKISINVFSFPRRFNFLPDNFGEVIVGERQKLFVVFFLKRAELGSHESRAFRHFLYGFL